MLLKQLRRSPHSSLAHMLRHVNDGSPSGYTSVVPDPFDPRSRTSSYLLPFVEVPGDDPALLTSVGILADHVKHFAIRDDRIRLCVHPLTWSVHGDKLLDRSPTRRIGHVSVVPTGSLRSVRTKTDPSVVVKLQFDGTVGRVSRVISRAATRYVRAISEDLHAAAGSMSSSPIAFLDEPITAHYRFSADDGIGIVFRSTTPTPLGSAGRLLIPGYALWSTDRHRPTQAPILQQIVEELGRPAKETIAALVLRPLLTAYLRLATESGLVPEAHGQNTYIELAPDLNDSRVVFQGLESFLYDAEVRLARGLPVREPLSHHKYLEAANSKRFVERAWYFDEKLLGYFVSPMIKCAARTLGVPADALTEAATTICDDLLSRVPFAYLPPQAWHQVDTGKYGQRRLEPREPLFRKAATHASV
jgi:hypothetical protein